MICLRGVRLFRYVEPFQRQNKRGTRNALMIAIMSDNRYSVNSNPTEIALP